MLTNIGMFLAGVGLVYLAFRLTKAHCEKKECGEHLRKR